MKTLDLTKPMLVRHNHTPARYIGSMTNGDLVFEVGRTLTTRDNCGISLYGENSDYDIINAPPKTVKRWITLEKRFKVLRGLYLEPVETSPDNPNIHQMEIEIPEDWL